MPIQVLMPALSPTMEKGNLAKWLKKEGETIKSGDVIAEIETDKATMEVEATDEGTLGRILIPEGTADVAVNTPIATILADGESAADLGKAPAPAPNVAKEAAKDKELTPVMLANLHEVMNICTRLMLRDDSPHLKLHELCALDALPARAAAIVAAPKGRIDFEVGLGKYGSGALCVMCL